MGALTRVMVAVTMMVAVPAHADPVARWQPIIAEASLRFGIPERWIVRVIRAESGGQTVLNAKPIVSRAGAMGLMQLMPATWAAMRASLGLGSDAHDPHDNIVAGTAYLRLMYDRFGYPGLFAAYNAGPGRYADHLASGRALPGETRAYLAMVAGHAKGDPSLPPASPGTSADRLFAMRRPTPRSINPPATRDEHGNGQYGLFVMLSPR